MKRILLMVLRNIVFVPYWWIKLCWYAAHTDDYPEEKKYAFLRLGGSFKTATKTKCPIVPVALIDSFKAFDTGSTERITVQVHILPPMYYEEYKDMHTTELAEEVKRRIEKVIEENIM